MQSFSAPGRWVGLVCLILLGGGHAADAGDDLGKALMPLIEGHKGRVSVMVRPLESGPEFEHQADDPMPTASLIKFPVMIEAYRQAAEGTVNLKAPVTLHDADKVPGSGILTSHFSDGATFPLRDAIRLMIVYSDNTATNLVLDQIGIPSTAKTMEQMGYPNTKIHSKVYRRDTSAFPERSQQFGLGSTTAREMIGLVTALYRKELVSVEASEAMLDDMMHCEDPDKFPRFLPAGTKVAMKTGSVNAARTAAGILYTPQGPVALCVLTNENEDQRWVSDNAGDLLCAKIAKAVYDHYSGSNAETGAEAAQETAPTSP